MRTQVHVVILQRPGTTSPCDRWIREADPEARITILTSRETVRPDTDLAPGVTRVLVPDYDSEDVLTELFRICDQNPTPDRVYANSEDDVLRAAEARTLFDIPGQRSASALAFRDKAVMKSLFAGLPTTPPVPYREVRCVEQAIDAARHFGAIVLKPRDGAGSVEVRVFDDADSLLKACRSDAAFVAALDSGRLMAEQYIAGEVFHADILLDGSDCLLVSPGRYTCPPHRFGTDNLGSVMLDESSEEHRTLTHAAHEFVRRLPSGHGANILHLEFLRQDSTKQFFAGEVACRSGGALIRNSLRHTHGVDPSKLACLLSVGLYTGDRDLPRVAEQTGWIQWTGGPALAVPSPSLRPNPIPSPSPSPTTTPDWLVEHSVNDRPGEASSSVDARAAFLVRGRDEADIIRRFHELSSGSAA